MGPPCSDCIRGKAKGRQRQTSARVASWPTCSWTKQISRGFPRDRRGLGLFDGRLALAAGDQASVPRRFERQRRHEADCVIHKTFGGPSSSSAFTVAGGPRVRILLPPAGRPRAAIRRVWRDRSPAPHSADHVIGPPACRGNAFGRNFGSPPGSAGDDLKPRRGARPSGSISACLQLTGQGEEHPPGPIASCLSPSPIRVSLSFRFDELEEP
jgi:hypothetical protein